VCVCVAEMGSEAPSPSSSPPFHFSSSPSFLDPQAVLVALDFLQKSRQDRARTARRERFLRLAKDDGRDGGGDEEENAIGSRQRRGFFSPVLVASGETEDSEEGEENGEESGATKVVNCRHFGKSDHAEAKRIKKGRNDFLQHRKALRELKKDRNSEADESVGFFSSGESSSDDMGVFSSDDPDDFVYGEDTTFTPCGNPDCELGMRPDDVSSQEEQNERVCGGNAEEPPPPEGYCGAWFHVECVTLFEGDEPTGKSPEEEADAPWRCAICASEEQGSALEREEGLGNEMAVSDGPVPDAEQLENAEVVDGEGEGRSVSSPEVSGPGRGFDSDDDFVVDDYVALADRKQAAVDAVMKLDRKKKRVGGQRKKSAEFPAQPCSECGLNTGKLTLCACCSEATAHPGCIRDNPDAVFVCRPCLQQIEEIADGDDEVLSHLMERFRPVELDLDRLLDLDKRLREQQPGMPGGAASHRSGGTVSLLSSDDEDEFDRQVEGDQGSSDFEQQGLDVADLDSPNIDDADYVSELTASQEVAQRAPAAVSLASVVTDFDGKPEDCANPDFAEHGERPLVVLEAIRNVWKEYQRETVRWLWNTIGREQKGGILALEMGLGNARAANCVVVFLTHRSAGKTMCTIAFLAALKDHMHPASNEWPRTLVLAPKMVVQTWFVRFPPPPLTIG
jgi:SNF2-related domain